MAGPESLTLESDEKEFFVDEQQAEIERLRGLMKGWLGQGWKDGEKVDCIQDYFDQHIEFKGD